MVKLLIDRYNKAKDWTISRFYEDGTQTGYSVEDEVRYGPKIHGETAIPAGTYDVITRISPKFSNTFLWSDSKKLLIAATDKVKYSTITDFKPHELFWIQNVPGFQYILIHWGNTDDDSDGCIIVGSSLGVIKGQEAVVSSRTFYKQMYNRIYPRYKNGEKISITIL